MKKFLILSLGVLIAFQFCGKQQVPQNQQFVVVKFIIGDVQRRRASKNTWEQLKIGEQLSIDNVIKTSANSQCDMQLAETGIFRLKQNSEMLLKNLFFDKKTGTEKAEFYLSRGKLFSKVTKLLKEDSLFNVETPTVVAGVRGTEFVVTADEAMDTKVAVNKGKVGIKLNLGIKEDEMKNISQELKNVAQKEIELVSSKKTEVKKETVDKIKEVVQENISEQEKITEIEKIVNKEIIVKEIEEDEKKSFEEFKTMEVEKEIDKKECKLIIETEPTNAMVIINNMPVGETPVSILFNIGEHLKIRIEKAGFKTIEKEIKIEKKDTIIKESLEQSLQSGSILWRFKSSSGIKTDIIGEGDKIYFVTSDGTVCCVNNQANQIWKHRIQRGVSSSPILYGNFIFVGGNDGILYCLSKISGKLSWQKYIGTIAYSKPLINNNILYAGTSEGQLISLNVINGKVNWKYKAPSGIYTTPATKGNLIFFGCEDGNLYSLDTLGNLKWKFNTAGRIIKSSPVIFQDYVFIGNYDNGSFYCVNIKDGSLKWKYQTGSKILSTPAISGTKVFFGSTDGNLYSLNISNGNLVWKKQIGTRLESSPVIKDGIIYIGSDDGNVYAIQTENGMIRWKSATGGKIGGSVIATAQQIFAGSERGELINIVK